MAYQGNTPSAGKYQKLDNITFDGITSSFSLLSSSVAVYPQTATNLVISINGVIQEPLVAFTVSSNVITFTEVPPSGSMFFGVLLGSVLDIGVPTDSSVSALKLTSTAITDKLGYTPANASHVHTTANVTGLDTALSGKQATLVSGTSIKTINSNSLLGSGDVAVEPAFTAGTTAQYYRGDKSWQTLDKAAVALGNVDNTSDATKNSANVTLTNKILGSGTVLAADVTGGDFSVTRVMLKDVGYKHYDSSSTSALDYTNGSYQRWSPSGSVTLSITNWPPTGNLGELVIEGVNLGAATITWPTVNWIKADGTMTNTFSSNGVTLQSSGTDFVVLWTRNAGTTMYGKVVR